MPRSRERAEQESLPPDEVSIGLSLERSVEQPSTSPGSATTGSKDAAMEKESLVGVTDASQLPLPLEPEEPCPPAAQRKRGRKGSRGFVPVTRDPDVARSYSDNVALDYAVARGLAQALQALPPEELAALRAKVARATRQDGKPLQARNSR